MANSVAIAQHPIDVQKASADGEHFKAITTYLAVPDRRVETDTRVAAAKSSWALGLHQQAAQEIDHILRGQEISETERARLTLTRGVIEFQEEHYREAALYAEKGITLLKVSSPLRSRCYLLWGQALERVNSLGTAEEKIKKALTEADQEDISEVHFGLGEIQMRLGKLSEAEENLKAIPLEHDRAPRAIRDLVSITLESEQFDKAKQWLEKGKSEFPEIFFDSWTDYGFLRAALAEGELLAARRILDSAVKQYPTADSSLVLMQAAIERSEWERRAQLAPNTTMKPSRKGE